MSEGKKLKGSSDVPNDQTELNEDPPFTIYTSKDKTVLIVVLASVGVWSTFSSPIFFPALPSVEKYFHLTSSVTNLSIVAYLLFQGIAPTFSSNIADSIGRRPIIIISMLIYIAACIALTQTNVYWLLTVLRCIQAAGIGPVIAVSSGVSGDVCTAADRGGFVGTLSGLQLVGNAAGGIIGAALVGAYGWRGIFTFLAIGSGFTLFIMVFILPETVRSIVGNGSVKPASIINFSPIFLLSHYKKRLTNDVSTLAPKKKLDVLSPFKILFRKKTLCVLIPAGLQFTFWTMSLASVTLLEGDGYNYSVKKVGYIYLPQGLACFAGSIITGKLADRYYRYRKELYDVKYKDIIEKPNFNILKTRVHICIIPVTLSFIGLIIFGWCLQYKQNVSSIIIATCLISYSSTAIVSICTTIMVDLHPSKASTSASCMNIVRCLMAAVGAGVLASMTASMGLGGCYTFCAGLGLTSSILLLIVLRL